MNHVGILFTVLEIGETIIRRRGVVFGLRVSSFGFLRFRDHVPGSLPVPEPRGSGLSFGAVAARQSMLHFSHNRQPAVRMGRIMTARRMRVRPVKSTSHWTAHTHTHTYTSAHILCKCMTGYSQIYMFDFSRRSEQRLSWGSEFRALR